MLLKNNVFFSLILLSIASFFHVSTMSKQIENDNFNFSSTQLGVTTLKGRPRENKTNNEDQYVHIKLANGQIMLGIFDGHWGHRCSHYVKENFPKIYANIEEDEVKSIDEKLKRTFFKVNEDWFEKGNIDKSGTNAVVTVINEKITKYTLQILVLLKEYWYVTAKRSTQKSIGLMILKKKNA